MTINIGQEVATTLRNRESEIADNIRNNNALLRRLNERGNWKATTGGRVITEPLMHGTNSNFNWYSGYEAQDIAPTDQIDAAEYDWKQAATWVTFSGEEEIKNRGKAAVLDWAEAKIEAAKADMDNSVAVAMYADGTGNGGKEFGGLQLLVDDDPTSAGTVGGIDQAANSFWRNYTSGTLTITSSNIQDAMNDAHLGTIRGSEQTDLILADSTLFKAYWASLQTIQRITSADQGAAGFASLKFLNADVVFDGNCPAKRMYFLNTKYLKFRYSPGRKFTVGEKRQVTNADYSVLPIWLAGNLTCCNRARQGVIIDD